MTDQEAGVQVARNRAAEQAKNSPEGLRQTARALRDRSQEIRDGNDRAAMLRLASDFERRAEQLEHRPKTPAGD